MEINRVVCLLALLCLAEAVFNPLTAGTDTSHTSEHSVGGALRALLRAQGTTGPACSIIIISDYTTTATAVVQGGIAGGYAAGGMTLLQLSATPENNADNNNKNVSAAFHTQLTELIKIGRKLRFLSGCFTVVFATDSKTTLKAMLDHSMDGRLMTWNTYSVIVTGLGKAAAMATVEANWVFTMMTSLLLLLPRPADANRAQVFRHEPFSPEGSRTKHIGWYTAPNGLVLIAPVTFYKFNNFFGNRVYFGTLQFLPYLGITETMLPNGTKELHFSGIDYTVLKSFGEVLNFKPTFFGGPKTWKEVEEVLQERRVLIVGSSYFMMPSRLKRFDFVAPYVTAQLAFIMLRPSEVSNWDNFLKPFLLDVWLYTLGIVTLLALSLMLVLEYSHLSQVTSTKLRGGKLYVGSNFKCSKSQALFEVFGTMIGQDFTIKMPHTHSFRILIATLFIFVIVLSTGYKAELISYMTSPKKPFRPETLKELVESNVIITSPTWGHDHLRLLESSSRREHQILAERYTFVKSLVDGLKLARKQGSAHADDRLMSDYTIATEFMEVDGSTDYYIGREDILTILMSLIIPHDAPYKPNFDRVMLDIVGAGLYEKWTKDELEKVRINKAEARERHADGTPVIVVTKQQGPKALSTDNVQGPFWILLCGAALATSCFLVELLTTKCERVWRKKVGG